MYADVQLRIHTSPEPDQYEWQIVDDYGWILYRSEFRQDCVDFLCYDANKDFTYTLKRVRVNVRPPLSSYAKAAMSLIVDKYCCSQKIACIKEVRAVYGLGLKDAKDLVEDYFDGL